VLLRLKYIFRVLTVVFDGLAIRDDEGLRVYRAEGPCDTKVSHGGSPPGPLRGPSPPKWPGGPLGPWATPVAQDPRPLGPKALEGHLWWGGLRGRWGRQRRLPLEPLRGLEGHLSGLSRQRRLPKAASHYLRAKGESPFRGSKGPLGGPSASIMRNERFF
jgi:hypothetical protein